MAEPRTPEPFEPFVRLKCTTCPRTFYMELDPARVAELEADGVTPEEAAQSFIDAQSSGELVCPDCERRRQLEGIREG